MANIRKKLEDIFAAAAFAEAGEHETARQIMEESALESKKRAAEGLSPSAYSERKLAVEEE